MYGSISRNVTNINKRTKEALYSNEIWLALNSEMLFQKNQNLIDKRSFRVGSEKINQHVKGTFKGEYK